MSVLGLAAAISKEMFETVYNACPDALTNAANDDITPLCVAAMKNDKELFFRLLELGMPLSTASKTIFSIIKFKVFFFVTVKSTKRTIAKRINLRIKHR